MPGNAQHHVADQLVVDRTNGVTDLRPVVAPPVSYRLAINSSFLSSAAISDSCEQLLCPCCLDFMMVVFGLPLPLHQCCIRDPCQRWDFEKQMPLSAGWTLHGAPGAHGGDRFLIVSCFRSHACSQLATR